MSSYLRREGILYNSMCSRPVALIFDWDNTLIDGTAYFAKVDAAIFGKIKEEDGVEARGVHEALPGETDLGFFSRLLNSVELGAKAVALFEEYTRKGGMPVDFMPGARELLRFLDRQNIPYAVHSNSEDIYLREFVKVSCEREGLTVPLTVGISEGTIPKKPDPAGIYKTLSLLSNEAVIYVPNQQIWMIGDSPKTDGMAGKNAGISVGIVPYDEAQRIDHDQWRVFQSLSALEDAIALVCN